MSMLVIPLPPPNRLFSGHGPVTVRVLINSYQSVLLCDYCRRRGKLFKKKNKKI